MIPVPWHLWFTGLLLCGTGMLYGQSSFRFPLDVPGVVTAGFGELRNNHFHSGLDFSTYGKSQAVYAVEEGYVSRLRASATGYGKAVYLDHPNGYMTVYAHLDRFNDTLGLYIRDLQEKRRNYELDTIPTRERFKVKKGQLIGWSGNSGSSTGPHLHFEVRDQATEKALNPQLYGFRHHDKIPPEIHAVSVFPYKTYGRVNAGTQAAHYTLVSNPKTGKKTLPAKMKIPEVSGWVGFGFRGGDVIDKQRGTSGIYEIKLEIDSQQVFHVRFDELVFSENRHINGYIDYEIYRRSKNRVQRCVVPVNATTGIYKAHRQNGYYYFGENRLYTVRYIFNDVQGNTTVFSMQVQGRKPQQWAPPLSPGGLYRQVIPGKEQAIGIAGFEAIFQPRSLFDTTFVKLHALPARNTYSPVIELGSNDQPINTPIQVRIKPGDFPPVLQSKLLIARLSGNKKESIGGAWKNGWLEARTTELGHFAIVADTLAPQIRQSYPPAKKNAVTAAATGLVRFHLSDQLSGTGSIQAWLNDSWILLEADDRHNEYFYRFPASLSPGTYRLTVEVTDKAGNKAVWKKEFRK